MINNRFLITVALGISLASCNMAERLQLSKNKTLQLKIELHLLIKQV